MQRMEERYIRVIQETAYAEFGSALEMLSACKLSEKENLCFGYFHHSKDEYNHTNTLEFNYIEYTEAQYDSEIDRIRDKFLP